MTSRYMMLDKGGLAASNRAIHINGANAVTRHKLHLASASLTWKENYKNLGLGLVEKGCSWKPKYLMIASVFICMHYRDSMRLISAICQVDEKVAANFATQWESCREWNVVAGSKLSRGEGMIIFYDKTQLKSLHIAWQGYWNRCSGKEEWRKNGHPMRDTHLYLFRLCARLMPQEPRVER